MKTRPTSLKILKAEYTNGHALKLWFSDGKMQIVDFGPFLKSSVHPEIRKYISHKSFKRFTVRNGDLMWGDFDLIFPIADLYDNKIVHDKRAANRHAG